MRATPEIGYSRGCPPIGTRHFRLGSLTWTWRGAMHLFLPTRPSAAWVPCRSSHVRDPWGLEAGVLEAAPDRLPPGCGDLGVAGDRAEPDVAQGLGGQAGVAELLLHEGAERMPQAVGVQVADVEPAGDLGADVAGPARGEPIRSVRARASLRAPGWKATKSAGDGSVRGPR